MTKWICKAKKALLNKKGELLFESIISLVVLTTFFVSIATIVQISFNLIEMNNEKINDNQKSLNVAVLENYGVGSNGQVGALTLNGGGGFSVGIEVVLYHEPSYDNYVVYTAFKPTP